ncbi:rna methylase [Plasmopara halstedii]|uniref:Trimethylguanosine synthase n=1 Tax=Plasmopara halstedii TaxID=4781 RepID=A0A0P1AQA2_PLAHL|nr:rna methylase [Plasmopara halstedii]CEG43422.1 rna methylase [Plasmopara halstedii]|eukprot:XP_024579791.1 rna methylase [Plasmopara halstedii]
MQDADHFSTCTSQPMSMEAQIVVTHGVQVGYHGLRQRSSSLDNVRLWRPASGFASKHMAEMEAKRMHRERQMQRVRQMQQMQEEKVRREIELARGPRPNDHVIVEEGVWKTVVSQGPRDYQQTRAAIDTSLSQPLCSSSYDIDHLDNLSVFGTVNTECTLSQDEMKTTERVRRKKRYQMKRRQNSLSRRDEKQKDIMEGVPHPTLLGEVMFTRRSSLQKLADRLHETTIATHKGRKACGYHNFMEARSLPDRSIRKTKSSSSMIVNHNRAKMHSNNASADSSPRRHTENGSDTTKRSISRQESPQSPRSGSDTRGSPRTRKCGDKRDFFFRNLNYGLRSQLQVDEVAAFSVTDYEMATKISQFVLELFASSKEDTVSTSNFEDHDDIKLTIEERKKYPLTVTDGTACVGGNVLSFCDYFTRVNAIENDATRVQMLQHNLQVLQKTNVKCIHANYLDVMMQLEQDVIFLDPPWGGPEYKDLEKVDLFLGGLPLHEICIRLQDHTKCIILKVPNNFDDIKFSQRVPGKVVIRRDLKKMHLILLDYR